jgi:hypothetical protein
VNEENLTYDSDRKQPFQILTLMIINYSKQLKSNEDLFELKCIRYILQGYVMYWPNFMENITFFQNTRYKLSHLRFIVTLFTNPQLSDLRVLSTYENTNTGPYSMQNIISELNQYAAKYELDLMSYKEIFALFSYKDLNKIKKPEKQI